MIEQIQSVDEIENLYKTGSHAPYDKLPKENFGYLGVLLSLKSSGKVQCHLCGSWHDSLGSHIANRHKIKAQDYKKRFGFTRTIPLCSQRVSDQRSKSALEHNNTRGIRKYHKELRDPKNAKNLAEFNDKKAKSNREAANSPAVLNKLDICDQQCIRRVKVIAEHLNHFPTWREVNRIDGGLQMVIRRRFGSWNKFKSVNFKEEPIFKSHGAQKYSDDYLLFSLKQWEIKNKKVPQREDFRNTTPNHITIVNRFGSWMRAKSLAGISEGDRPDLRKLKHGN
jgi:hypothetical protein